MQSEIDQLFKSIQRLTEDLKFTDKMLWKAIQDLMKYDMDLALKISKEMKTFLDRDIKHDGN